MLRQLGFSSAILDDLNLEAVLGLAAKIGYRYVEVMCWPPSVAERRYSGVTHIDLTQFDSKAVESVKKLQEDAGVEISALGYYPNVLSPNAAESAAAVDHLMKLIAAAPKLGLSQVNSFIGRNPALNVDANWPRMLETWRPILKAAEDVGVRIGIENCPMFFSDDEWPGGKNLATTPRIWERMFNDIASPNLGLNYDPSHMVWQQMDYILPLRQFKDRLFHVHAKDVRIDREKLDQVGILANPSQYHTPKLPGLGEINWGKFFSVLGDVGYTGPVCVEVEDRSFEGSLAMRQQSLVQSFRYLSNFLS